MKERCKNCRAWEPDRRLPVQGTCQVLSSRGYQDFYHAERSRKQVLAEVRLHGEGGHEFSTHPDFGCALFEKKPKKQTPTS